MNSEIINKPFDWQTDLEGGLSEAPGVRPGGPVIDIPSPAQLGPDAEPEPLPPTYAGLTRREAGELGSRAIDGDVGSPTVDPTKELPITPETPGRILPPGVQEFRGKTYDFRPFLANRRGGTLEPDGSEAPHGSFQPVFGPEATAQPEDRSDKVTSKIINFGRLSVRGLGRYISRRRADTKEVMRDRVITLGKHHVQNPELFPTTRHQIRLVNRAELRQEAQDKLRYDDLFRLRRNYGEDVGTPAYEERIRGMKFRRPGQKRAHYNAIKTYEKIMEKHNKLEEKLRGKWAPDTEKETIGGNLAKLYRDTKDAIKEDATLKPGEVRGWKPGERVAQIQKNTDHIKQRKEASKAKRQQRKTNRKIRQTVKKNTRRANRAENKEIRTYRHLENKVRRTKHRAQKITRRSDRVKELHSAYRRKVPAKLIRQTGRDMRKGLHDLRNPQTPDNRPPAYSPEGRTTGRTVYGPIGGTKEIPLDPDI